MAVSLNPYGLPQMHRSMPHRCKLCENHSGGNGHVCWRRLHYRQKIAAVLDAFALAIQENPEIQSRGLECREIAELLDRLGIVPPTASMLGMFIRNNLEFRYLLRKNAERTVQKADGRVSKFVTTRWVPRVHIS